MDLKRVNTLNTDALRDVFINQLSLLFAAKSHLIDSLPALINQASFVNLKHALSEDLTDSKLQMTKISELFTLLEESADTENCLGMNAIIKEAHHDIKFNDRDRYKSDMSIIFYMGVIENLQIGAGRMVNLIALNSNYKQYAQLVKETLDMCKDNANLFHLIAEEYLQQN